MNSIILAIKPKYSQAILNHTKTFEYRKKTPQQAVDKILLYETYPTCKIVGEVEVCGLLKNTPQEIWQRSQKTSGIEKKAYFDYFAGCDYAYAYVLKNPQRYINTRDLSEFGFNAPIQSFAYVKK